MEVTVTLNNTGEHPIYNILCKTYRGLKYESFHRFGDIRELQILITNATGTRIIRSPFPKSNKTFGLRRSNTELETRRKLVEEVRSSVYYDCHVQIFIVLFFVIVHSGFKMLLIDLMNSHNQFKIKLLNCLR
jgi:hypothetical protein